MRKLGSDRRCWQVEVNRGAIDKEVVKVGEEVKNKFQQPHGWEEVMKDSWLPCDQERGNKKALGTMW